MNKAVKIIAGVVLVVIVVAALAIALSGPSDDGEHDYEAQAKQEIDRYGYGAEIVTCEVDDQTILGAGLIIVTGTFLSEGQQHEYELTLDGSREVVWLYIDGNMMNTDKVGDAEYDYRTSALASFEYTTDGGYTFTEYPDDGMKFVLAEVIVRNAGHMDGLHVSIPDLAASDGNTYDYDLSTFSYSETAGNLSELNLSVGNTVTFFVVYEIPEDVTAEEVLWDNSTVGIYGYVHVPGLL